MIQKIQKCLVFSMLIVLIIPCTGQACTTFLLEHDGRQFFGKNYDWHLGSGLAIINQRGITKTALKGRRKDPVAYPSWTSKYGSLTFNQYGRELPSGGINEAGLTIEVMMLYETQYSKPDARNPITELQWIQFQLDNCSSVNQVIETNSKIRILHKETPVHFLVADKSGNCVSIEWIDGKMVYHTKDSMPVKVLANNTYKDSIRYLNRHKGFGGTLSIHHTGISLDRFVIAASMLKQYQSQPEKPMADYAFDILKNVSQVSTQWSIVYDLQKLRVHFIIHSTPNRKIKFVDLLDFDLSCNGPVKVINLETDLSGNITDKFSDYSREKNQKIIKHAFSNTSFVSNMDDETVMKRVLYPETTTCDN